ncbi:MAG: hypothetical protein RJA70_2786 [Pseudomonadota bacterium]|jgi:hypothetical protein
MMVPTQATAVRLISGGPYERRHNPPDPSDKVP